MSGLGSSHFGPALAVFALALSGCGGEDVGRPPAPDAAKETEPVDWCEVAEVYEFLPIMDFEPAVATESLCNTTTQGATTCNPNTSHDSAHDNGDQCLPTAGENRGRMTPMAAPFGGQAVPDGRCDAPAFGVHVVATGIAACVGENGKIGWGANLQVDAIPAVVPDSGGACDEPQDGAHPPGTRGLDASCWDGISFWAKKGNPISGTSITMTVADPWTNQETFVPAPTEEDPDATRRYCDSNAPSDSGKCDAFGAAISLSDEWTYYALPFGLLKQKGYGVPTILDDGVDTGNIKGVSFLITPGDWDFWLDDVSLYRARQ